MLFVFGYLWGYNEKEFFNVELGKIYFHDEKGMEKGKHIMPGSPL